MNISSVLGHRNRSLLRELVITDFKLRYQGSVLGYLWSLLRPIFIFSILLFFFGFILKIGANIEHYPLYLLLGIVLWSFFLEATGNGLQSIVARGDLIRKVRFPKYIVVISGTIAALINLGISMVVVVLFMLYSGASIQLSALWILPLIVELYVFALALSFFLAALYVRYRDIGYLWEVILQAAFYATPIIYPVSIVQTKSALLAKVILLNPVAQVIQDARHAMVSSQSVTLSDLTHNLALILFPFLFILLVAVLASSYFRRHSKYFAEEA
jgi:ABC-2 type transport system permease protein